MTRKRAQASITAPLELSLEDPSAERVRRSHAQALSDLRAAQPTVIQEVKLASGVETPVPHGLGKAPLWVSPSAPRGAVTAGRIDDMGGRTSTGAPIDRTKIVMLRASGWGATITVDVAVL